MHMCGCQLALAEAHVPTSASLLPILSSSCLCFATAQKGPHSGPKTGVAIQLEAQLTNSWLLFWADGLGGCLSVKRALNCDNERRSSMVFVRSVAKMLVSQYICLTNLIIASISFTLAQKSARVSKENTQMEVSRPAKGPFLDKARVVPALAWPNRPVWM